jgi:polyisoprenoid-binding protein YceI
MKCFVCIFFTIFAATGLAATTYEFKKDCKDCDVKFEATASNLTGFGGAQINIQGEGGKLRGKIQEDKGKVSGELTVSIEDFEMGMRTFHFNSDMDIKKYKTAKIKIKDLPASDGEHELKAELTIKNVTKPITGTYKLETDGNKKKLRAKFEIKLDDFRVNRREVDGIVKVDNLVTVHVDAVAQ